MPVLNFTARTFKFVDRTTFSKVVSDHIVETFKISAADSFRLTFRLVRVYTGESRGGLRELAAALQLRTELMRSIRPKTRKRIKNRHGRIKSPTSALSGFQTFRRTSGNRIVFTIFNDGDGFKFKDRKAWGFGRTFSRKLKQNMLRNLRTNGIPIKRFSLIQRVS